MEFTSVVVNSKADYPIKNTLLAQIPYFEGRLHRVKVAIECPLEIEQKHLRVLVKIMSGTSIIPIIDASSHRDVLIILQFAKYLGIEMERLDASFRGWTENRRWMDLWYPEYMYLVYVENEDLVDFRKFFRLHKSPFESVAKAARLPEMRANAELYIEMLIFFKNFDFALCFDNNNDMVQGKIEALNKMRAAADGVFLVNPHEEFMKDYFDFTPAHLPAWDCKGISAVNPPEEGCQTICDLDTARARVEEFTHSLLEKPLNPLAKKPFPFANVAFAGGAVAKILGKDYNKKNARQSDVDLFIFASSFDEKSRVFEEIIDWFRTYNIDGVSAKTYYALRGSVTTIYIKDIARKFQIISINSTSPYEIVSRFDLTHIQWFMLNGQFFGTPEACMAMREKMTRFSNVKRLRVERLVKALHCGYSIHKNNDVIENLIDITNLIEDPTCVQLQKIIRDLHGWYYPQTNPDMDPEEETQHILCMVEKDAGATLVTIDPQFVLSNVTIGGNFENGYESNLFSTFNPATIVNRAQGRAVRKVILRSKHGVIRLTTPILKVNKVTSGENGVEIRVRSNDGAFKDFCNMLEGQVFRMFRNGGVTRNIINNNEIKFTVPRYRLDNQAIKGVSCFRSQRGAALNIEEDLNEGDDLQVLFLLEVIVSADDRAVDLKPLKFVKYQKYDPEAEAKLRALSENIERETEYFAEETEFNGEIIYADNIL